MSRNGSVSTHELDVLGGACHCVWSGCGTMGGTSDVDILLLGGGVSTREPSASGFAFGAAPCAEHYQCSAHGAAPKANPDGLGGQNSMPQCQQPAIEVREVLIVEYSS